MEVVKKTDDYVIYQKKSKRYAIRNAERKWISGEDKVKILVAEKLLDIPMPKPKEKPAPEAEAASNEEASATEESEASEAE